MNQINEKNVLVYVRPWNKDFYFELANNVFGNESYISISEFKGIADIWLNESLYTDKYYKEYDDVKILDVYRRCRFLRTLRLDEAILLIKKMSGYIEYIIEKQNIKFCLGVLVDNYTGDILEYICKKRDIPYISLVPHFFNGYTRVSSRGELSEHKRIVSDEEVNKILYSILNTTYKPNFDFNSEKTYLAAIKFYYREKLKFVYFNIKKHLINDKYNYHYNSFLFREKSRKSYVSKEIEEMFYKISDIENKISFNSLYLPLHFTPEATVDYWTEDSKDALYEESILDIIRNSDQNIIFFIKEHPAMYMKRNRKFYDKLVEMNNIYLIHPYENSNYLLSKIEKIYVTTGSVGVEALIRNKIVFSSTRNYYSDIHPNIYFKKYILKKDLLIKPVEYSNHLFVRDILEKIFPATFSNNWNIMNSDIDLISKELRRLLTIINDGLDGDWNGH